MRSTGAVPSAFATKMWKFSSAPVSLRNTTCAPSRVKIAEATRSGPPTIFAAGAAGRATSATNASAVSPRSLRNSTRVPSGESTAPKFWCAENTDAHVGYRAAEFGTGAHAAARAARPRTRRDMRWKDTVPAMWLRVGDTEAG